MKKQINSTGSQESLGNSALAKAKPATETVDSSPEEKEVLEIIIKSERGPGCFQETGGEISLSGSRSSLQDGGRL